jgi:protein PhnA
MNPEVNCPKCNSENIYLDGNLWVCPECAHEWTPYENTKADDVQVKDATVRDASGNALVNGDAVTVIKDLKIKGSSMVVKSGTKVRNIRLVDEDDGHNIACKIDGMGAINLKSEFVRKV